jgi:hypothetical protein
VIQLGHLKAALAFWAYCETSAQLIFRTRVGERLADYLLAVLRVHPAGQTRTELSHALGRNYGADKIHAALELLQEYGLAHCVRGGPAAGPGRPPSRWFATKRT